MLFVVFARWPLKPSLALLSAISGVLHCEAKYHLGGDNRVPIGICLLMACAAASGFQPQTGLTDPEREKDVYAIYSLMLTNPETSHAPYDGDRLLIQMTTKAPSVHPSCVRPPRDREAEFREVLADYERRKTTSRQLKPLFSIPKPYMLLTDNEVRAFSEEHMRPFAQQDDRFRSGVSDYFTLSDVYFNQGGTLAVTALSSWCGGLCAQSQWRVFEKLDIGKWVERQWRSCAVRLLRTLAKRSLSLVLPV